MYKHLILFMLSGFYTIGFAMEDLPQELEEHHSQSRKTRLVGSATERSDEDDALHVAVDLSGTLVYSADDPHDVRAAVFGQESGASSSSSRVASMIHEQPPKLASAAHGESYMREAYVPAHHHSSRTSSLRTTDHSNQQIQLAKEAVVVDLDDDLHMSQHPSLMGDELLEQILMQLPKPGSSISPEERRQNVKDLLERLEAQSPVEYRRLTQGFHDETTRRRNVAARFIPSIGIDVGHIYGFTQTIVAKVLEDENQTLNDKVLTEQERTKAAKDAEFRIKIVSGVATGIVFTAFILAQSLSTALASSS